MYVPLSMYCEEPRKPWGNVQGADEDLRKCVLLIQTPPCQGPSQARNWQNLPLLWVGMLAVDGPLCANTSHCDFLLPDTCNLRPPACRDLLQRQPNYPPHPVVDLINALCSRGFVGVAMTLSECAQPAWTQHLCVHVCCPSVSLSSLHSLVTSP